MHHQRWHITATCWHGAPLTTPRPNWRIALFTIVSLKKNKSIHPHCSDGKAGWLACCQCLLPRVNESVDEQLSLTYTDHLHVNPLMELKCAFLIFATQLVHMSGQVPIKIHNCHHTCLNCSWGKGRKTAWITTRPDKPSSTHRLALSHSYKIPAHS